MSIAQLVESDTAFHVFQHSDAETIEALKEFTVVEAARRELLEEVGLDIPVEEFRQAWQQINQTEFKKDHIILFEVHLQSSPTLKPDGREVVWFGFRNLKDALSMPVFSPVREYLLQQLVGREG